MLKGLLKKPPAFDFRAVTAPCRDAGRALSAAPDVQIDAALQTLSRALIANTDQILSANDQDIARAQGKGLSAAMIDRLSLDASKIAAMADAVEEISRYPHPAGKILSSWERPNGLKIQKIAVPIGVLGMIYESRPNVTIDAAALCLKSRNAVILRGGSEALETNKALHAPLVQMLIENNLPQAAITFIADPDRAIVADMLAAHDLIDVLIPRGGKGLTGRVMREAKMPVFAHLDGNCHVYIHESADPAMALAVTLNAKLRRTGICGAAESLLIDKNYARANDIIKTLLNEGVEIVGDKSTQSIDPRIGPASEDDWCTEYLDKKISAKFVNGVDEAIAHINQYGSHHTDAIIATEREAVDIFTRTVDSAIVLHNTSTQFADGGEFGFGAEIGIGTGKLHARGPVGLEQLCTFKYIVRGQGQTRA